IIGIARFAALESITEKTALHEHGRISGQSQYAEICGVHAAVGRMRNSHQLRLNPMRQVVRIRRMIIRFETVNTAPPRIVKMNTDEDGILLRIFDRDSLLERNEDVG